MLTLYEEMLLLAIHEDKGIFIREAREALRPGLAGAVLAELAFAGRIATVNHRLKLVADTSTEDAFQDAALALIKESVKERKFGYWVNNLNPKPEKFLRQVTTSLVQKEVFTQEDDHLTWVIPSPMHPKVKASLKFSVVRLLRGIVLAQEEAHPREIAFLSLVSACGWLELLFLRDERKSASQRINELLVFHAMQDPTLETIQEISSAIVSVVEED